ncbi:MAG: glycogen debranching enzyme family protein [Clostridia bacterium]|nr:glycogen debranching enzyme family protein [Clostridia bacterium]
MKFKNIDLNTGLEKEWLITNGIGGFASSTIIGANTRRYHGLLIAPITPPARRYLVLSKVDESIEIDGEKFDLYTNVCKNYISNGYKYLKSFEKNYIPIYTYEVKDVIIKKYICMEYGKNTVVIFYQVVNKGNNAKLILTPILNFRDFHSDTYGHEFSIRQEENNRKLKVVVDGNSDKPIYINVSEGTYIKHENDSFKNMYYIEEEKRGFNPEENHAIAGRYEIEIGENEERDITFVASLEENIEEISAKNIISGEVARIAELTYDSELFKEEWSSEKKELIRNFIIATDNFVVYRPSFGLHTIIAGYPWFLDWGRDSLISFEGLLLKTKRYEIAKEVLQTMIRDMKFGLVPNGYSGYDNRPLYNSVDSSLLLFEQIEKYLKYTFDEKFIKENFYEKLKIIIASYKNGIDVDGNNIYLDEDGLINSGSEFIQNTWMDAKIGAYVVTPRNGKAVEINAMWYNALKIMEELALKFEDKKVANEYKKMAEKTKKSFEEKFYNKRKKCLYDVLGDPKIRPNQLYALSLTYPVIDPTSDIAKEILDTVTKKLLNSYGLKTLAKGEENYVEVYEGDSFRRDMSYHQGITWPWLLGVYYDSLKNIVNAEKNSTKRKDLQNSLNEFKNEVEKTFVKEFQEGRTIGGIHEIYDSRKPFEAKGTINQAWSVAEVFRIILENN